MSATAAVAAETETPAAAEGDAPAEETQEAPAEGVETPVEAPAEGEKPAEEKPAEPKPAEIPEEVIQAAAFKYANKTMAAARRAEARMDAVKTENTTLKESVKVYEDFVGQFKTDPFAALGRLGFGTLRSFLEHCQNLGEPKPDTAETRIERLERERKEERETAAKERATVAVEESKRAVFASIDADKARWARAGTGRGHREVWEVIEAYFKIHGEVPDEIVPRLADEVEKDLRAEFGDPPQVPAPAPGAKTGTTPAAAAAPAGRTSGNTLTNKGGAGAPARREYSMDPDERRRQVSDDLRAEGLL